MSTKSCLLTHPIMTINLKMIFQITIIIYSPAQVAAVPFQLPLPLFLRPLTRQVLLELPIRSNPSSHVKLQISL